MCVVLPPVAVCAAAIDAEYMQKVYSYNVGIVLLQRTTATANTSKNRLTFDNDNYSTSGCGHTCCWYRRPLQICMVPPLNLIFLENAQRFSLFLFRWPFVGAPCTVHKYTFTNLTLKGTMVRWFVCAWSQSSEETIAPQSRNNDDITVGCRNDFHLRHRFIYARALQCPFRKSYSRWLNFSREIRAFLVLFSPWRSQKHV